MSDLAAVRRAGLAGLLTSRGFVRVADASLELGVSEVTIRADLTALEREGRAVRARRSDARRPAAPRGPGRGDPRRARRR
ncbi:MAG: DeoR family transcriptional regulator [Schumannella sp.]